MHANSRPVSSRQVFTHPRLAEVVRRHLRQPSRKPVADHNRAALTALEARMAEAPRPLVLDSFCGTGQSSALLAQRHPEQLVVGIDKSGHRLQRHRPGSDNNYLLLQAECEDIWRLVLARGWPVSHHYLLYPNPWPKPGHLQRRVHGHPAFATLVRLGGQLELRSNWQTYVEEFGTAMTLAGACGSIQRCPAQAAALTLFEQKYRDSHHPLWRYTGYCRATVVTLPA